MLVLIQLFLFVTGVIRGLVTQSPVPHDFSQYRGSIDGQIHPIALNAICENLGDKPLAMINEEGKWVGCMHIIK